MSYPKVFISYSHDSSDHKNWVLNLGKRLWENGIEVILDQWDLQPGDDIPHFMEINLPSADYILMICSNNYVHKADSGRGGVGYEKMIITASLMIRIDEAKVIPIICQKGTQNVPTFLKTKLYIDLSDTSDFELGFNQLIRKIHNYPIIKKPKLGLSPYTSNNEAKSSSQRSFLSKKISTDSSKTRSNIILRMVLFFGAISVLSGIIATETRDQDFILGTAIISGLIAGISLIAYLISLIVNPK